VQYNYFQRRYPTDIITRTCEPKIAFIAARLVYALHEDRVKPSKALGEFLLEASRALSPVRAALLKTKRPSPGATVKVRGRFVATALAAVLACPALADVTPGGATPPRYSIGNFTGGGASPLNYIEVSGGVNRTQNFESLYLEKTISPDASFSLFAGYQRYEQQGDTEAVSGFTNIGLAYKRVLYAIPDRFTLSLSPMLELPTSSGGSGEESHPRAGGEVLFEIGFIHLPESIRLLRPTYLEGDSGWDSKVTGARDDQFWSDLSLGYSLKYLDTEAARSMPRLFRHLSPYLEFSYAQYLSAHRNSSIPDFELTPAISWFNDIYEIDLGVEIPVNAGASSAGTVSFVWSLGVSYDQLIPALGWNLFH
jgi:hypothetical protein